MCVQRNVDITFPKSVLGEIVTALLSGHDGLAGRDGAVLLHSD